MKDLVKKFHSDLVTRGHSASDSSFWVERKTPPAGVHFEIPDTPFRLFWLEADGRVMKTKKKLMLLSSQDRYEWDKMKEHVTRLMGEHGSGSRTLRDEQFEVEHAMRYFEKGLYGHREGARAVLYALLFLLEKECLDEAPGDYKNIWEGETKYGADRLGLQLSWRDKGYPAPQTPMSEGLDEPYWLRYYWSLEKLNEKYDRAEVLYNESAFLWEDVVKGESASFSAFTDILDIPPELSEVIWPGLLSYTKKISDAVEQLTELELRRAACEVGRYRTVYHDVFGPREGGQIDGRLPDHEHQETLKLTIRELERQKEATSFVDDICKTAGNNLSQSVSKEAVRSRLKDKIIPYLREEYPDLSLPKDLKLNSWRESRKDLREAWERWRLPM